MIERHEIEAAASPAIPLRQLAARPDAQVSRGNFQDFEKLIEQLGMPPVFELGKPMPDEKYLPGGGVGSCPAAHNRALLDEDGG
jgi:hypothetical protein